MALYKTVLNPFTGKFTLIRADSAFRLKEPVDTKNDLPLTENQENDARFTKDTDKLYVWSIASSSGTINDWLEIGSVSSIDWANITNKPSSSVSNIDDAVSKRHTQNTDTKLDEGGANESTVSDIKDAVDKKHNRSHAIDSSSDHTSTITENNLIDADANGLPDDSGLSVTDTSDAISKKHDRLHDIDSASDHNGVSGAVEDNFVSFDGNGLPKDSGVADSDITDITDVTERVKIEENWTLYDTPLSHGWRQVTYGDGLYVGVSDDGTIMTSPDGIKWTQRTSPVANEWWGVTYGNGIFVAVGYTGTGNRVITSTDGITWTARTNSVDNAWTDVCYGNGLFVAVSYNGSQDRVMTSPDGITWTTRTTPASEGQWTSVVYGNNAYVAVAYNGLVMSSTDGISWTNRTASASNHWMGVTYGNGLFVAVSNDGTGNRVMTSPDGVTWTSRTSSDDNAWRQVTYGEGVFVAIARSGTNRIMTSPDGITWTTQTSAFSYDWRSLAYGNGIFVSLARNSSKAVVAGKHNFLKQKDTIAHVQNTDIKLDEGGSNEVSASEIKTEVDAKTSISHLIDGMGSAITTGVSGWVEMPFDGTIEEVRLLADQSGDIQVDIWKDTYANYPPTDADSITASAVPAISSGIKYEDTTLTGWTTSFSKGDILYFNVDSDNTIEKCLVSLIVSKS